MFSTTSCSKWKTEVLQGQIAAMFSLAPKVNAEVFYGVADLGNGTGLDLVITRLEGTSFKGRWKEDTDLVLLGVLNNNRSCICRLSDHWGRYVEKLGMPQDDAEHLAKWFKENKISELVKGQ